MKINCSYCEDLCLAENLHNVGKHVYACDTCKKTLTTCPTCKSESVSDGICLVCGDTFTPNYHNEKTFIQNNELNKLCECGEMATGNDVFFIMENQIYAEIYCKNCDTTFNQLLTLKS
jgi:ribosomal protein L32